MAIDLPPGYMHVIKPYTAAGTTKRYSVTFGISLASITPSVAQDAINGVDTVWNTVWASNTYNHFTLQPAVGYHRQAVGEPLQIVTSVNPAVPGGGAATLPPSNTAAIVRKRTNFVGRAHRGRMYIPGLLTEADVDNNGFISAARQTGLQTLATQWRAETAARAEVLEVVLLHTVPVTGAAPAPTNVTSVSIPSLVGSQRRRLG